MIDLNVKTLMRMTHLTLPYMKAGACIYQLGSLSAFQPVPYINVYAATKAFVLHFSRALNKELEPRGIRVLAVCPGWVRTEFFDSGARKRRVGLRLANPRAGASDQTAFSPDRDGHLVPAAGNRNAPRRKKRRSAKRIVPDPASGKPLRGQKETK